MRHQIAFGFASLFPGELVVDLFAGGGGASTGIEAAIRRPVDHAVNHDRAAIAMHEANHPRTRHYCEDVWAVSPREVCGSRRVGLLWASPDCKHHSKAKGGRPRDKNIRALANVVIEWAREVRPRIIHLENVEEFEDWGPLDEHGYPIQARKGEDFRAFVAALIALGYQVEWKKLVAADYGTPTSRKRLFMTARCDGRAIVWPTPSHGVGRRNDWRPAFEIIDWSLPCRSIFGRPKSLADATLRRIATGIKRYVIDCAKPFIVPVTHPRDARVHSIEEPLRTVTAAPRGELALVSPTLIQMGYGERPGQAPRVPGLGKPLGTVVAGGGKHAVVAAFLAKHYGGPNGHKVVGHGLERTIGTVTTKDHHAVVTAHLLKFYGTSTGLEMREPLPTVTAGGNHLAEVRALLTKYCGATDGRDIVTVDGQEYEIADIGMRMLAPRELFSAQGFPASYIIDPELDGKPLSKTEQIDKCGNSVCPQVSEALVRANACERYAEAA